MSDPKPLVSFEWNDQKRINNINKHGIDFEDALLALQEPRVEFQSIQKRRSPDARDLPRYQPHHLSRLYDARRNLQDHLRPPGTQE